MIFAANFSVRDPVFDQPVAQEPARKTPKMTSEQPMTIQTVVVITPPLY
jgi:hypothetical protein